MLVQYCVHYIHQSTAALQDCYHFISSSKIKTNGEFFDCFLPIDNTNDEACDSKVITLSRPTALLNPVNILSPFYSINIWCFENLWFLIYLISLLCDKELYPYISKALRQESQGLILWVTWKASEEVKIYSTVVSHSQQLRKFDMFTLLLPT